MLNQLRKKAGSDSSDESSDDKKKKAGLSGYVGDFGFWAILITVQGKVLGVEVNMIHWVVPVEGEEVASF